MAEEQGGKLPAGGVDERKYSILYLALGIARGALYDDAEESEEERSERRRRALDLTATMSLADLFGYEEAELAVDWHEHLTEDEVTRVKSVQWDDELWRRLPPNQRTSR